MEKMSIKEIKDFLILLLNKELEEELGTTNDKEWIASCIQAKKWLMEKQGIAGFVNSIILKEDIDKYLLEKRQ